MKLLLTSAGVKNKSIARALIELVGKPAHETSIAFIPTAANVEEGSKDWLITDLNNLIQEGYKSVDIVDISALPKEMWEPRLKAADILFFGGGNSFHLMHWLKKSGLADMLPELLTTRVYAGISAGSMVASKDLSLSQSQRLYYEDLDRTEDMSGLGFVDFYLRPHLNSPYFTKIRKEYLEELAQEISEVIYALDDNSALKVVAGKVEIVSEGECLVFNN
ncbi:MAG: peptidase dipeptidase dipeptidase [Candidatus Paceibacter sp.]|jgi:dipeptidase E|nr:peptidase dipeptidase dipeptidase [Candidatus Paceibacter sp.]